MTVQPLQVDKRSRKCTTPYCAIPVALPHILRLRYLTFTPKLSVQAVGRHGIHANTKPKECYHYLPTPQSRTVPFNALN